MFDSKSCSRRFSLGFASVVFGLAFCACLEGAQAQKTDYELNTPYVCPNGTSYTFTKRTGTGYASMCYYTIKHNGRLFTKAVSACRQMTGYLRGCKLQRTASAPAANRTQATLPTTEDWHSRPTNPAYLAAMPYVEKVTTTISGTSPDDTLARRVTVFNGLREMIMHLRDASRPFGSPWTLDEMRIRYVYYLAAKKITDDYARTHTPSETSNLSHKSGHYEFMDDAFYRQWTQVLLPKDFLDAYNKAAWGMLAQYSAHVDQERKQAEEWTARQKAAQQAAARGTSGLPNGPGYVAARRCLELGGSELQCLGKGLSTSFFGLVGMKKSNLFPTSSYTGPTLTGQFKSGNGIGANFLETTVAVGNCGKLIIAPLSYTMERRGSEILVHVKNSPSPVTFVLEADGRLQGPSSAEVAGKVITGYQKVWVAGVTTIGHTETSTQRLSPMEKPEYEVENRIVQDEGAGNYKVSTYVPGSTGPGHWAMVPIYAPKTQSCAIGALMPAGPTPINPGVLTVVASAVNAITGQASSSADKAQMEMPPPGIRMAGVYTSQGGLKAEFATASVVLDCGEAHVRDKYTVERKGGQILIHVQNPASPFTATVQPDGSLSGPASVEVAGRVATGMTGDQVNYVSRHAQCGSGRLFPNGAAVQASSGSAVTGPRQVAASAPAVLSVASGFPTAGNPLAGRWVFLMDETMDNVASDAGLHPPAGITACQAWAQIGAACRPATKCAPLLSTINKHTPGKFRMPASGRGAFPSGVHAGTYYVLTIARVNNAAECWNVRVNLTPGSNAVTLSTRNGEKLR